MDRPHPSRRSVLAGAAGLGLLPFLVNGCTQEMTPAEARHRGVPLRTLQQGEAAILARLGEVLLPGADEAGMVHFVDHHLSVPAEQSLLMIRYMDVPPPFADFYRAGLAALDGHARAAHGQGFAELPADRAQQVVGAMGRQQPEGWLGPPSQLLYFVTRSDAVDVVYGTPKGFERLGLPYMPHIEPERFW